MKKNSCVAMIVISMGGYFVSCASTFLEFADSYIFFTVLYNSEVSGLLLKKISEIYILDEPGFDRTSFPVCDKVSYGIPAPTSRS